MQAQTEEKTVEQLKAELHEALKCLGAVNSYLSEYIHHSEHVSDKRWPHNKVDPIPERKLDGATALSRRAIYMIKDYCGIDFW